MTEKSILRNVNFEMLGNARIALLDENGSGKTSRTYLHRFLFRGNQAFTPVDSLRQGEVSHDREFLELIGIEKSTGHQ